MPIQSRILWDYADVEAVAEKTDVMHTHTEKAAAIAASINKTFIDNTN